MHYFAVLTTLVVAAVNPSLPAAAGLTLLYDDRIALLPSGEPIVTVAIATHQARLVLRSAGPLYVDFYTADTLHHRVVPAHQDVTVTVHRAWPAARYAYVDLATVPRRDELRVNQARAMWLARGVKDVTSFELGTVLDIGGFVLDNREVHIIAPAASPTHAAQRAEALATHVSTQLVARERLAERPLGELALRAGGSELGVATSGVRFSAAEASGTIEVAHVEYGQGYAWHGFADRGYRGDIYATLDADGGLVAVNALGAETLLFGVVPAEIFASAPREALRAQAIAARNTLLAKIGTRHINEPFHLCSEQHCQVYAGVSKEDPRTTEAVRSTGGQALFYRGKLVDAVYSSSCGGHTEDNEVVWGNAPDPALRGKPDFNLVQTPELRLFSRGINSANIEAFVGSQPRSFCADAKPKGAEKFRWTKVFSGDALTALMDRSFPSLGRLKSIDVITRGVGGRVQSLNLVGAHKSLRLERELSIRQAFGNLNSAAFAVVLERDAWGFVSKATFTGGGWGHGVGLCQLGAIGRAKAGYTYDEILSHYYNGAKVTRLYNPTAPTVN